jgi:hypothetical protein
MPEHDLWHGLLTAPDRPEVSVLLAVRLPSCRARKGLPAYNPIVERSASTPPPSIT